MKRKITAICAIILLIIAGALLKDAVFKLGNLGNLFMDPVIKSLPRYEKEEYFSSGGFQDYTDYAKYTYRISESDIAQNEFLCPVMEENIPTILEYVENFEGWVEICKDFPSESYDFDKALISMGDYFFISNHYEEPERAFWNYNLYYFDVDASILYFFHSNI